MLLERTTFKHNPSKSRNTGIAITDHFQLSMEGLTQQFDCFVFFPSNELELVQRELEEKLSHFANFNVRANDRTRLETQFDLAKLYERIEFHEKADWLYRNISAEIIKKGITDEWYLPPTRFTRFDPGDIDFDAPLPTPEELEEERTMLLHQQRQAVEGQEHVPENNLNRLSSQFGLAELCRQDILEEKKEAEQIYRNICTLAFTIGIPDQRR